MKELKATKQAETQARRQAAQDKVQRLRTQWLADAAMAKATKAAERGQKAPEQQHLRAAMAAEMA